MITHKIITCFAKFVSVILATLLTMVIITVVPLIAGYFLIGDGGFPQADGTNVMVFIFVTIAWLLYLSTVMSN